ncbi:MAG: hypothetical protein FWC93_01155 [Defluviitaleaceae bacterium]|nr:hypothetical protein [Defluviitaleaceae bacterium]
MVLNNEITRLLAAEGCSIVGFADFAHLPEYMRPTLPYGISIGLAYSKKAMGDNRNGQPQQYYDEYKSITLRLPILADMVADYLTTRGYTTVAAPVPSVIDADLCTTLPHKTVATLSGLGWIGKCAALVTKDAGPAVRITAVLTDAPFDCGEPISTSNCPAGCTICANVCPGKAVLGENWSVATPREHIYDAHACNTAARAYAKVTLGLEQAFCSQCIAHCPYTERS